MARRKYWCCRCGKISKVVVDVVVVVVVCLDIVFLHSIFVQNY